MKKLLFIILSFTLPSLLSAQYEETIDVSDALQDALNVRTSAVKIMKDYLYRGLKVNYVSQENDNNLAQGENSILKLEIYAKEHPGLYDEINRAKQQWKRLRVLAIQEPQKEKMDLLLGKLKELLSVSKDLIEKIKKTDDIKVINYQHASNEMEVLAQELAFLYALKTAEIDTDKLDFEIKQRSSDFQKNLDATFFSGENTIPITETLKSIQADWEMVKKTVSNTKDSNFLNTLYVLTNKISKESGKAALLYQEMAKKELRGNH